MPSPLCQAVIDAVQQIMRCKHGHNINPRAPSTFLEGVWGGFRGSKYVLRRHLELQLTKTTDLEALFNDHDRKSLRE